MISQSFVLLRYIERPINGRKNAKTRVSKIDGATEF
jgi:hypothetical protein